MDGCISNEDCNITINHTGTLTCSVKRIRPHVSLKWKTLLEERNFIRFTKDEIDKKLINGMYDVILTSSFQIINDYVRKITVECVASNPDVPQLNYRRRLELHVLDKIHTTGKHASQILRFDFQINAAVPRSTICNASILLICLQRCHQVVQLVLPLILEEIGFGESLLCPPLCAS